ncbi:hypothetical protein GCM10023200_51800 [Actinomycetospora chlora]|uniref:Secreted protein n=1 Tax=Actinomycetospora chlora TaxID=663608 RepID=A0ABP9CGX5_9PSEU
MKTVVLALGGATAAAWMAVPVVSMAVRGTIDQRTLAACHRVPTTPSVVTIPTQRRGTAGERLTA